MRKALALFLAFIPLFASCNKKGSFTNPFPNDEYKKTGFTFAENERIVRSLSSDEIKLVNDTISKKDEYDDKIIFCKSVKEERNYLRAFSGDTGEFKQGYNVANIMSHLESKSYRQNEDSSTSPTKKQRTYTSKSSKTVSNYTYGDVTKNVSSKEYIYYATKDTDNKFIESNTIDLATSLNIRTSTENNGYKSCVDSGKKVEKSDTEGSWTEDETNKCNAILSSYFKQSKYMNAPDQKSGADINGNIILVKATQEKINKGKENEGILELGDGRKYQAMNNTLIVTKLEKRNDTTSDNWCLASYVREYTETVVTSEIIQPNVPIEKLKEPITIYYLEEIMNFSNVYDETPRELTDTLPTYEEIA